MAATPKPTVSKPAVPRPKVSPTPKVTVKPKATSKPKPAASPTSINQIDIDMATMAKVPKGPNGENLQFTDKDPNTYSGTYKGKRYTWQSGGFLK